MILMTPTNKYGKLKEAQLSYQSGGHVLHLVEEHYELWRYAME